MSLFNEHLSDQLKKRGWPAGQSFAVLGGVFGTVFLILVLWLALDQRQVLESSQRLQGQTVPGTLEHFRLARNIEQLRLEGERVFSGRTAESRQQALFVVSLVASHPALLADNRAASLARETETFLMRVAQEGMSDVRYLEWATLSSRLSLLADDVSVEGVTLVTDDLRQMSEVTLRSRLKLGIVLALVAGFVALILFLVRRHLVGPLQVMSRALLALRAGKPVLPFAPSAMAEIRAIEGAVVQLQTIMQENEQTRQQLEHLATTDGLTELFNRRHFMPLADAEIIRAHRYERPICVALADLDWFKRINDSQGHAAGDQALQAVAAVFRETLRQCDQVCRYGGEEFAFVFPETTLEDALFLAERLRKNVAENAVELADGSRLHFTLSLGLADASYCSLDAALKRADEALYAAKEGGRNRVVMVSSADDLVSPVDSLTWIDTPDADR